MPDHWSGLTAALVTSALMWPLIRLLRAVDVMDVPNARSSHVETTPRGAGVAMMAGVLVGTAVGESSGELWLLVGLALVAAAVGLVDDLRGLSAGIRLLAQFALALVVVAALLSNEVSAAGFAIAVIAVVGTVGYVNAFNFMDGINGISGISGALAGAWYLYLGLGEADAGSLAVGGAVLLGASLGFLPWNLPRAHVFLGDVGSYGLGLLIAGLALMSFGEGISAWVALSPLLVYGADTVWTLARRLMRGESLSEAHREHVYQRLCDQGLTHPSSSAVVGLHTLVVCAAVLLLPLAAGAVAVGLVLSAYLCLPRMLAAARVNRPV